MKTARKNTQKVCLLVLLSGLFCSSLPIYSQVEGSALNYLLQKRQIAHKYEDKKFGDHLFIEGGVGASTRFTRRKGFPYLETPGVQGNVAIGDWATPTHGWRIGGNGGTRVIGEKKTKTLGISADYMLNITSLSQPKYSAPRNWEFIGIAGMGFSLSHNHVTTRKVLDAHIGLRSQLNIHDYTYLYLEPRFEVVSNGMYHTSSWRRYNFAALVNAGVGTRLVPETRSTRQFEGSKHFLSNTFAEISAGPSFLFTSSPSTWSNTLGASIHGYLGKWWDPYSATRIGLGVGFNKRSNMSKNKNINLALGYMLNLHNTFGGYNPDRKYWVDALVDVTGNITASGRDKYFTPGIGAGLQGHFRVGKHNSIFLEPRVDLNQGDYMQGLTTMRKVDLLPSLRLGANFAERGEIHLVRSRNEKFTSSKFHNHLFVEAGIGANLPVTGHNLTHLSGHIRPSMHVGIGKWFHPTSGLRLWANGDHYTPNHTRSYKAISVGADYLWNITNTMIGYDPAHRFEMIASTGINTVVRQHSMKAYFGGNLGLRAQWNANEAWGFYLEPQLKFYDNAFLPKSQLSHYKVDAIGSLQAGLQINMHNYLPQVSREAFGKDPKHSFFSLSAGMENNGVILRTVEHYGPLARLSFGKWYTPVSAWRFNINGFAKRNYYRRYARLMTGADYMVDFTTLGLGYNTDRIVSLRGLAGAEIGVDMQSCGRPHFLTELHAGAQLAFALGKSCEIYAEPQVGYELSSKKYSGRLRHFNPRGYLGLNWKLNTIDGKSRKEAAPEKKHFVTLAMGSGWHTGTVMNMPLGRKFNYDIAASYGQWYNAVSGWSVGMKNNMVFMRGKGNTNIMSIYADYLFNLLTMTGGAAQHQSPWILNGYVGATLNMTHHPRRNTRFTPGVRAGVQMGRNIGDSWAIYLEPNASVTSRRIWVGSTHPADGQVGLLVGTRYRF